LKVIPGIIFLAILDFYHPSLNSAEADFKRPLLEKRRGVPSFVDKTNGLSSIEFLPFYTKKSRTHLCILLL
jgi:hypothetical protein